jgi:acid phosphatase
MPAPTIISRSPADETLFPNDSGCRRFAQISRAFAERTALRWNDSNEMSYITSKIGKWMPGDSKEVAVDSRPRLTGIMDTVNATDAHPDKATKLPKEFYDPKVKRYIDEISVEEWFRGYTESREYRMLGIGGLLGDVVGRMVSITTAGEPLGITETGGEGTENGVGRGGEQKITFALSGCHDTTLAAALASLGAFGGQNWPPFTSHIAVELFKKSAAHEGPFGALKADSPAGGSWWSWMMGGSMGKEASQRPGYERKPLDEWDEETKRSLAGYYVRLRYNDNVMKVPGCKSAGKHLDGDDSFCTLVSSLSIITFTP